MAQAVCLFCGRRYGRDLGYIRADGICPECRERTESETGALGKDLPIFCGGILVPKGRAKRAR